MPPTTGTALALIVFFVLPGAVTLLIAERTHILREKLDPFDRLLRTLYYSALTYVVVGIPLVVCGVRRSDLVRHVQADQSLTKPFVVAVVIVLVLPVAIATTGRFWAKSHRLRPWAFKILGIDSSHSVWSAWDHAFADITPRFCRVVLADGRVLGGLYSSTESFAGYGQHAQDLLLSERWELDEDSWFVRRVEGTAGLWIPRDQIRTIEFYTVGDDRQT